MDIFSHKYPIILQQNQFMILYQASFLWRVIHQCWPLSQLSVDHFPLTDLYLEHVGPSQLFSKIQLSCLIVSSTLYCEILTAHSVENYSQGISIQGSSSYFHIIHGFIYVIYFASKFYNILQCWWFIKFERKWKDSLHH